MENWFPKNGLLKLQVNIMMKIGIHIVDGDSNWIEFDLSEIFRYLKYQKLM